MTDTAPKPLVSDTPPLSDERFMGLVERMLKVGGEWRVSMSKAGCWLTYDSLSYAITSQQAGIMFDHIPRKCGDSQ